MASKSSTKAFTIVELLIVVVVIGILAAITIVSYSGITSQAYVASIKSDLTNAKNQLLAYQSTNLTNSFPTAINCNNPSATEICIKSSNGTTYTYNVNNSSNPPTFNLTGTNGSNKYWINDSSATMTNPDIVTNGLVLNLDAANPASYPGAGTTWYDLSGNGNNGTLYNSPSYTNVNSSCLSFDGTDDYASVTTISSTAQGFSIGLWISGSRWGLGSCPCASHSGIVDWSTGYYNNVGVNSNYGGPYVFIYNQSVSPYGVSVSFNASSLNTWYYIVATFGPSGINNSLKTYTNGIVQGSASLTGQGGEFTVTAPLQIASYMRHCGNCWLQAKISHINVYNRPLSAQEVNQNFNALRGRYGI